MVTIWVHTVSCGEVEKKSILIVRGAFKAKVTKSMDNSVFVKVLPFKQLLCSREEI